MRFAEGRKRPKFCIITPTVCSHPALIYRCATSVRLQTFKDYIHVICADGPNEKARGVCGRFGDLIIYDETEKNYGHWGYGVRNYVINKYDADYYLFLDDDNYLYENCLEVLNQHVGPPMLVFQCLYFRYWTGDWMVIPGQHEFTKGFIDTMNTVRRQDLARKVEWEPVYEQDFHSAVKCQKIVGDDIAWIDQILGVYMFAPPGKA